MAARSRAKTQAVRIVPDDLEEVVAEALRDASGLPLSKLKRVLPKPYQRFEREAKAKVLELVRQKRVCLVKKGRGGFIFLHDPFSYLNSTLLPAFSQGPLSEADLSALVDQLAPGHEVVLKHWLRSAVARKLLYPHKKGSRGAAKLYGRHPDLKAILGKTREVLRKALVVAERHEISQHSIATLLLAELGLTWPHEEAEPERTGREATTSDEAAKVEFLDALRALGAESPRQALHSLPDLRKRTTLDKTNFDRIALALAREETVSLHHHDHPASMSPQERNELVQDSRGTFYIGVAPRRKA
jgi:hypothetical protein